MTRATDVPIMEAWSRCRLLLASRARGGRGAEERAWAGPIRGNAIVQFLSYRFGELIVIPALALPG